MPRPLGCPGPLRRKSGPTLESALKRPFRLSLHGCPIGITKPMQEKRRPSGNEQTPRGKRKEGRTRELGTRWAPRALVMTLNAAAFSLYEEKPRQNSAKKGGKSPSKIKSGIFLSSISEGSAAQRAENHAQGMHAYFRPLTQPCARSGEDRGHSGLRVRPLWDGGRTSQQVAAPGPWHDRHPRSWSLAGSSLSDCRVATNP